MMMNFFLRATISSAHKTITVLLPKKTFIVQNAIVSIIVVEGL